MRLSALTLAFNSVFTMFTLFAISTLDIYEMCSAILESPGPFPRMVRVEACNVGLRRPRPRVDLNLRLPCEPRTIRVVRYLEACQTADVQIEEYEITGSPDLRGATSSPPRAVRLRVETRIHGPLPGDQEFVALVFEAC
jgi:hypothetical protein